MDSVKITVEVPANVAAALASLLQGLKVTVVKDENDTVVGDVVGVELPRSAEEVVSYCEANGLVVNGEKFYNYYKDRGWKNTKGKPIDDWQQLIKMWDETDRKNAKTKLPQTPRVTGKDDMDRLARQLGVTDE